MTPQDAVAIFTIISYNKISVLLKSMDHFATLLEELMAITIWMLQAQLPYTRRRNYTIQIQACMLRHTDI